MTNYNSNAPLKFISDEKLTNLVRKVIEKAKKAALNENIYRNVIDPFSALFDCAWQEISLEEWLKQERSRQTQKTLQNFVGEFHQALIGGIEGWEDMGIGKSYDVRCTGKKIIAEVKNKHNTMNSKSQIGVYDALQRHLDADKDCEGYTAYCVLIVPNSPKSQNRPFCPSDEGSRRPVREDIRKIDGQSFYELVTGDSEALSKVYHKLPHIISIITGGNVNTLHESEVFEDLFKRAYGK